MNDYEIGSRVGLPIINIMNKDATLNAAAGKYAVRRVPHVWLAGADLVLALREHLGQRNEDLALPAHALLG